MAAVAAALNYANPRSVGNRLSLLRKRYGLAITTNAASSASSAAAPGGGVKQPAKVKKPGQPRKSAGSGPRPRPRPRPRATKARTQKKASSRVKTEDDEDVIRAKDVPEDLIKEEEE